MLLLLILLALAGAAILIWSFMIEPLRLRLQTTTITSPKLTQTCSVLYFSDLHYSQFFNQKFLMKLQTTINRESCDVILFGGDLIDRQLVPSQSTLDQLEHFLHSLQAEKKIAIWGNHEHLGELGLHHLEKLYQDSGFILLNNRHLDYKGINFIGLDSAYHGYPDLNQALAKVDFARYSILNQHVPDYADLIATLPIDIMLSAHSHGGQIRVPLIGALIHNKWAKHYDKGSYPVNHWRLDVSTGVGTTKLRARLFCPPTIYRYDFAPATKAAATGEGLD